MRVFNSLLPPYPSSPSKSPSRGGYTSPAGQPSAFPRFAMLWCSRAYLSVLVAHEETLSGLISPRSQRGAAIPIYYPHRGGLALYRARICVPPWSSSSIAKANLPQHYPPSAWSPHNVPFLGHRQPCLHRSCLVAVRASTGSFHHRAVLRSFSGGMYPIASLPPASACLASPPPTLVKPEARTNKATMKIVANHMSTLR